MPFIGRDWRANGEQWTKTAVGSWQPSRQISSVNTSLSDVFKTLDMINSVYNIRRLNYIVKVNDIFLSFEFKSILKLFLLKIVQILFKEKLSELSGNAQRYLFQILERMIDTGKHQKLQNSVKKKKNFISVSKTGDNITSMQRMITQFHTSIHSAYPFYYYIGSEFLWRQHIEQLTRMKERLKTAQDQRKFHFDRLPIEIQGEILKKLDNGKDLLRIGSINRNLYYVTQELLLWKQLCLHHYGEQTLSNKQIIFGFLKKQYKDNEAENIDWKKVYFKLKRRYGLREIYAEMISQCQACKTLFWQVSRANITIQKNKKK